MADILRGAALYVRRHGWIKGDYYAEPYDADGIYYPDPTPPACVLGTLPMPRRWRGVSWRGLWRYLREDYQARHRHRQPCGCLIENVAPVRAPHRVPHRTDAHPHRQPEWVRGRTDPAAQRPGGRRCDTRRREAGRGGHGAWPCGRPGPAPPGGGPVIRVRTCHEVTCDRGCDGNGWDDQIPHFASRDEAIDYARRAGFVIVGDTTLCQSCAQEADCAATGHQWDAWHERQHHEHPGVTYRVRWCEHCGDCDYDPPAQDLAVLLQAARILDATADTPGSPNGEARG